MHKTFVFISIIVAVIFGILSILAAHSNPAYTGATGMQLTVIYITSFFMGLIPVLGIAALLKYIGCCGKQACSSDNCSK